MVGNKLVRRIRTPTPTASITTPTPPPNWFFRNGNFI
jgi:hypothetical protein